MVQESRTVESPPGLRTRVAGGVRWKLVGQGSAQATSAAASIVLAHLLTPHDFGLAGMALVFAGIGAVFGGVALSAALIQRPVLQEEDRSTAFWTSAAAGTFFMFLGIGISPLVADFFGRPAVAPLFAATSVLFLLSSLSATQTALLTREMNFRSLEIRGIASGLAAAAAAVALGLAGAGAWAMVGQALVQAGTSVVLLWTLSPWRPTFTYSMSSLRTLGSYSGKTLASQVLGYLVNNVDNLLIGRFLGSVPLGIYTVAYNTMFLPLSRVSMPIQQVLFSAFAKLQSEPRRLADAWARGNQVITAVNVPAFLGMAVVAPDFVPVVLGDKWRAAAPVLQFLSLAGVGSTLQTLNWSTVQAIGKPGVMLRFRLFSTPVTLLAFAIGLHWGVVGVAASFAISRFVVTPVSTVVTCRTLGCSPIWALRGEVLVTALAAIMAGVVALGRIGLMHVGVSEALRLAAVVPLGIVVYAGLLFAAAPNVIAELRSLAHRRRR
jgi:O-antigen/teichoic acid export membrane protein